MLSEPPEEKTPAPPPLYAYVQKFGVLHTRKTSDSRRNGQWTDMKVR